MKIAIIKLSAMGDIIHAMVALQYIKKYNKDIKIDWFVEKVFAPILEHNPDINNIIEVNLKKIKKDKASFFKEIITIRKYKNNNYDLVIDAQGLIKSAIVSKLIGKNIAGFSKKSIREGFASFFYKIKVDIAYEKNTIDRNAKVLSTPLNFSITKEDILNKKTFLFYKNEDKMIYDYLKSEKKNILFVIGASWDSKKYSKEKFVELIKMLDFNCLLVWGNENEYNDAVYIEKRTDALILPKMSLNTLKAIISKSDLVLGNDTGPTHMAWALNIPSLTLFGNTPGYRNTYQTKINKIIESNSLVDANHLDKKDYSISTIETNDILFIVKELLA